MHYSSDFPISTSATGSSHTDVPEALTSVELQRRFPLLSEKTSQKYRALYNDNVGPDSQLSVKAAGDLFSYLNLKPRVFTHLWSLCDIRSSGSLSLPEFLLFVYFLTTYLSSGELPTALPSILYQELLSNNESAPSPTGVRDTSPSKDCAQGASEWRSPLRGGHLRDANTIEGQEKAGAPLASNKEPPDGTASLFLTEDTNAELLYPAPDLQLGGTAELRASFIDTPLPPNHSDGMVASRQPLQSQHLTVHLLPEYPIKEDREWEEIEQLKAKIQVLQNEIHSVEASQSDIKIDFEKVTGDMIDLSEQRYQLELAFREMTTQMGELVSKARHLNETLANAKYSLLHTNRARVTGENQPDRLIQSTHELVTPLSALRAASAPVQTELETKKVKVDSERRRADKEIDSVERQVQRMNKRLERSEQYIHLYSDLLSRKEGSPADGTDEFLDAFMTELKNLQRRVTMTEKAGAKPLSPIEEMISVDLSAVQKTQKSHREKQMKILEEAQKRLVERERCLRDDFTRLKEEKSNMDNRIRRQEDEWESIRLQALTQAQNTIANARAEMEAAREETASKANRNNRARLAEETQVIEKLAQEKIEAATHERYAIERLAKQKIDAACQEKELIEKKFRERICQVETALKKTEHEKQEIKSIYGGKQSMCNSPMPPPNPPPSLPPLPVSISPSLTGIKPLWLAHTPPSPTDFPRTSISTMQRSNAQPGPRRSSPLHANPYAIQPHILDSGYSTNSDWSVNNHFVHVEHPHTYEAWGKQCASHDLQPEFTTQRSTSKQMGSPCSSDASDLKSPFSVKTLYPYTAPGKEYLGFDQDVYIIVDPTFESEEWWYGKPEYGVQEGWFPKNYVCVEEIPDQVPFLARVLYDYEERQSDELTIKADSVVDILEKTDVNWWKAQYQGNVGMIPARYVQQLVVGLSQ
ncbi:hypothetical protein K493DRAFT_25181 [Basidiobolus meristosporus CBS 931.73]|uniref:Uncharacterized protein n=1 Tax=Basidiobolus meristosporus CBS 931.73 TaxID=1314790 RepID=A0A1Y1YBN2_9FUNG|nr:hypothetical protein K493DRAFT_25181 [Basidiobolus meristosporus CBS 931.73]|eukprot:ORX95362.1 hypothetical protein K493DRAFT_25181 [Basidiobolus meristosporus CBS 931.73]